MNVNKCPWRSLQRFFWHYSKFNMRHKWRWHGDMLHKPLNSWIFIFIYLFTFETGSRFFAQTGVQWSQLTAASTSWALTILPRLVSNFWAQVILLSWPPKGLGLQLWAQPESLIITSVKTYLESTVWNFVEETERNHFHLRYRKWQIQVAFCREC